MTPCGHTRHVGTCPECQRAQLARWRSQLAEATERARVSPASLHASDIQWNHADPIAPESSATLTTF